MRNRLTTQMESTDERIHGRKYTDAVGEAILNVWETLPIDDIVLEGAETSGFSGTQDETDSAVKSAFRWGSVVSLNVTHTRCASIKDDDNVPSSSYSMQQSEGIDEKEGSVKSNGARNIKTAGSRREEFKAKMHVRHREAIKDVNNHKDDIERRKQLSEVEQMDARCRQRADQLFSRLQAQMAEFEDLHTDRRYSRARGLLVK